MGRGDDVWVHLDLPGVAANSIDVVGFSLASSL